jgi:hypothetical protein
MNQLSYNKIKLGVALFFATFLLNVTVLAQPCVNPGQTAATAFPVCGSTLFTQTNVPPCAGIATPSPSCSFTNSNPYFYKFTVVTSGTLGFLITPVNMAAKKIP